MASKLTGEAVRREAARPMPYFSHDSNAADDVKCRRLILRHGFEGYGRWWRLCELMAFNTGHHVPYGCDEDFELLCDELRFETADELGDFVRSLADVGLISAGALGDGQIASDRMDRNAEAVGKQRAAGSLGGRPKKGAQNRA